MLDDMDNFTKVFELRALADARASVDEKLAIINTAIEVQPFNQDAMLAKINLYAQKGASRQEWLILAKEVKTNYAWYPLPMHSFMKLIEQKTADAKLDVLVDVEMMRVEVLEAILSTETVGSVNPGACRQVAEGLLGKADARLATFSFDGANAGKIVLGPQLDTSEVNWEYTIDGQTWKNVKDNQHAYQLSEEEIASISAKNDIKVRFVGAESRVTTIDITEGAKPDGFELNHPERRIYMKNGKELSSIEAQIDGKWVKLNPDVKLPASGEFKVRSAATGTALPSTGDKVVTCSFTDKYDIEGSAIVPASELAVHDFSSENSKGERADFAVDGYLGADQFWHNSWGGDENAYITIDLGRERTITDIDYWNHGFRTNGMVYEGEISFAGDQPDLGAADKVPADRFSKSEPIVFDWDNQGAPYGARGRACRVTFDEPVAARYVRIRSIKAKTDSDSKPPLFTASELQFYESRVTAAADVSLGSVSYGADAEPVALAIKNDSNAAIAIDEVKSDSENFTVVKGSDRVAPDVTDDTWRVALKTGVPTGDYQGTVTVRYHGERGAKVAHELKIPVSATVVPASRAISVEVAEVTKDTAKLAAKVSQGDKDGAVEHALTKRGEAVAEDA